MKERLGSFRVLLGFSAVYCLASLVHFAHNAVFLPQYPNMPIWLTRSKVCAAWLLITAVGVIGLATARSRFVLVGLLLMAVYAAFGFDGLGHYALAPISAHTLGMNLSIAFEVAAAAVLLLVVLRQVFYAGRGMGTARIGG